VPVFSFHSPWRDSKRRWTRWSLEEVDWIVRGSRFVSIPQFKFNLAN
jgi:hypothetical protein